MAEVEHLPLGSFIGFPEYLRKAGLEDAADHVAEAIADGGRTLIQLWAEEVDILEDFLDYKSIRSRMN